MHHTPLFADAMITAPPLVFLKTVYIKKAFSYASVQ